MVCHSKSSIQQEEYSFRQQIKPKFKEGAGKVSHLLWCWNLDTSERRSNTWEVLKFVAGEGWKGSVGPIVWRMKKYCRVKEARNVLHTINGRKGNWIGRVLHRNCLLKYVIEGKIKVTERRGKDLRNYWITWRKREDTGNWKNKHHVGLCE